LSEFSPGVKNLLPQSNTWTGTQTIRKNGIDGVTTEVLKLRNETPSTSTVTIQSAPAIGNKGSIWDTGTSSSKGIESTTELTGVSGTGYLGGGILRTKMFKQGDGTVTVSDLYRKDLSGNAGAKQIIYGAQELEFVHGNQDPGTSTALMLNNTSGQYTNQSFKFSGTIKSAITAYNDGAMFFKAVNNATGYQFMAGGNITSQSLLAQIYSGGLYTSGNGFFGQRVCAGNSDVGATTTLSSYGSFAAKGTLTITSSYQIPNNEMVTYADCSTAFACIGTPTNACSSYTGSGQATCETHSVAGCSWDAGTPCSTYTGSDQGNCETGHAGCTWESLSCSGANNSDQTSCEALDDSYGGTCAWDTTTCPAFTNTASCNGQTGCTATVDGDCGTLSDGGGDGTNCATQPECSYNSGDGVCSGTFFTACTGNLCGGSYYTGTCSGGNWGAACIGTASCSGFTSSGPCTGEAGCSASSGCTLTLPPSTNDANRGNTSRFQYIKRIGATGTVNVVPYAGDTLESAISLTSNGQSVLVHHHYVLTSCTGLSTQTPCEAESGCTWNLAIVCADLMDESSCNAQSGAGCSWSGTCTGAGTAANCSGTYTSSKRWYKLATI